MKKISLIIALLALVLPGCFTDNSVSPGFGDPTLNSKEWIQIEGAGNITIDKEVIISREINGKTGGVIDYNLNIANISVAGSLTIPKNSFNDIMNISTVFSNQSTSQTFGPSPFDFSKSLLLTLEYTGVNLNGIDPDDYDFYYIDNNGQFYKAEYTSITIDPSAGVLKVVDAKINHFSRWGWAKNIND